MNQPILSDQENADLREIERLLNEAYTHYFANSDGHCKSSEGHIALSFNNFFDRRDGAPLSIKHVEIYSYVLGPSRSHDFASTADALIAVQEWHRREMAEDYTDGGPILPVEKMFTDTEG